MAETTLDARPSIDWRGWALRVLALAGILISAYLTYTHVTNTAVACGGSGGCDVVRTSVYSEVAGVPVALLGLLSYLAILVLHVADDYLEAAWADYIPLAIFGLALVGVLYSAYLTYLELFVIYAICRWCVASAVVITGILVLSIFDLRESLTA